MTDPQALPPSQGSAEDIRAGESLRRSRESQGLSIAEVANALKLNPRQIEALESGRFDLLPGVAFTRGFLRNYARLLKIDAAPLLAQLQPSVVDPNVELAPTSNAQGEMPVVGRGRFRRSVIPGLLAALLLLGIVVAGWYYDTLRSRPVEDLAASQSSAAEGTAIPESAQPAAPGQPGETITPVPIGPVPPQAATSAASGVAPPEAPRVPSVATPAPGTQSVAEPPRTGTDRLVFEFAQDAWVEIKDANGKVVFSRLGKAGSKEQAEVRAPFSLVVGNARYVKLERNGAPVDLGASTKVTVARLKIQ